MRRLTAFKPQALLAGAWLLACPAMATLPQASGELLERAISLRAEQLANESPQGYLGQLDPQQRIHRLLMMDANGQQHDVRLSHAQSLALAEGALMPLPAQASDEMRLEIQYAEHDAPPALPWQVQRLTLATTGSSVLLRRPGWRFWQSALLVQPHDSDADLQAARFALLSGEPLQAAARFRAVARQRALPWGARLQWQQARQQLGFATSTQLARLASQAPPAIAAQARLALAQSQHAEGDLAAARRNWQQIRFGLPETQLPHFKALGISLGLDPNLQQPDSADLSHGVIALAHFNRAAAQLTPGHLVQMEQLAAKQPADEDSLAWAVRDQANLSLGYSYLRQRRPRLAEAAFLRVRADHPAGLPARLGLGWAQIAAAGGSATPSADAPAAVGRELGALLRPRGDDATAQARRLTPFRTAHGVAYGHRAEDLRRALGPWMDLIGADPLEPAVQESLVAIPYALIHLGAFEDARTRLMQATTQLDGLSRLLLQALASDALQALVHWLVQAPGDQLWLRDIGGPSWWRQAETPRYFYLARLMAQADVQRQLQSCRNLNLASQWAAAEATLQRALEQHSDACTAQLRLAIQAQLQTWQQRSQHYLAEARLALARLHDGRHDLSASEGDL